MQCTYGPNTVVRAAPLLVASLLKRRQTVTDTSASRRGASILVTLSPQAKGLVSQKEVTGRF
jgi:hypothetical protein